MNNRWTIFCAGFVVAVMVVACIVVTLKVDLTPEAEKGKRPVRAQNLAEGIKVSRRGLYGVNLVSVGRARMRKLRKGPFTIGAINELVLEDVSLVLPEELWKEKAKVEGQGQDRTDKPSQTSAKEMLGKLGIEAGSLKMGGKMPSFSALAIRNLRVSRLEGTNAVPWFAAASGKAERGGLRLNSGWSVEDGVTNGWKEAVLVIDPQLKLFHL